MLQAIDAYRDQIAVDENDLGTSYDFEAGHQPDLDELLKRWKSDPVGQGLRQGIRQIGEIVAPHVTFEELKSIGHDAADRSQNAKWSDAIFNHMWDGLKTSDGQTWMA